MTTRTQQSYTRPLRAAIAEGATTPNPGTVGALVYSTTTGGLLMWSGTAWTALASAVTSVAGRQGVVTLTKTDVGLSNVDNTSDADKPVSTAQTTALALKANLASPTFTGTVTTAALNATIIGATSLNLTGGAVAVVRGAAANYASVANVTGDGQYRWARYIDGKMEWGPGNAALDTNLYRSAADTLKTDDSLIVGTNLTVSGGMGVTGTTTLGALTVGAVTGSSAIQLIRAAGNVTYVANVTGDTQYRYQVDTAGKISWGPGNVVQDTNLYRSAAAALVTDHSFTAGLDLQTNRRLSIANVEVREAYSFAFATSANEKLDIYIAAPFYGTVEVTLAGYSAAVNVAGLIRVQYAIGIEAGGVITENVMTVLAAQGALPSYVAMMPAAWDSANSRLKFTIAHRNTIAVTLGVAIRVVGGRATDGVQFKTTTGLHGTYTTDATVPSPNFHVGANHVSVVTITAASYTVLSTDQLVIVNNASMIATLPSAIASGAGRVYTVKNINATAATVKSANGTIDGVAGGTGVALSQYQAATFISDGTNWHMV